MSRLAPYKDFIGNNLHEGDKIIHPDGQYGTIVFKASEGGISSQWLVIYKGGPPSRLCLQVGPKGQAVKYKRRF